MGALSKLWVIIENTNSTKAGKAPVAHMSRVLELLGKTVVFVGHCNNAILVGVEEERILPSKARLAFFWKRFYR